MFKYLFLVLHFTTTHMHVACFSLTKLAWRGNASLSLDPNGETKPTNKQLFRIAPVTPLTHFCPSPLKKFQLLELENSPFGGISGLHKILVGLDFHTQTSGKQMLVINECRVMDHPCMAVRRLAWQRSLCYSTWTTWEMQFEC